MKTLLMAAAEEAAKKAAASSGDVGPVPSAGARDMTDPANEPATRDTVPPVAPSKE